MRAPTRSCSAGSRRPTRTRGRRNGTGCRPTPRSGSAPTPCSSTLGRRVPGGRRPLWETGGMVTVRGRVVLPDAILDDGVVQVRDGLIAAVGPADTFAADVRPAPTDDLVLPGLVDLHCHGGGGHSFPDALTPGEALAAVAEHRRHGTTTLVASLVTAPVGALRASTALLADLADAGEIAGIHFEGPFISAGHLD